MASKALWRMHTHSLHRFPVPDLTFFLGFDRPGWWFAGLSSSTSPVVAWLAACFKLPVVGVDHLLNRFHHLRPDALDLFQFFGRHGTQFFHCGYARLHQLLSQLFTQTVIHE